VVAQTAGCAVCGFSMGGNEPWTAKAAVRATPKLNERTGNVYENKGSAGRK